METSEYELFTQKIEKLTDQNSYGNMPRQRELDTQKLMLTLELRKLKALEDIVALCRNKSTVIQF